VASGIAKLTPELLKGRLRLHLSLEQVTSYLPHSAIFGRDLRNGQRTMSRVRFLRQVADFIDRPGDSRFSEKDAYEPPRRPISAEPEENTSPPFSDVTYIAGLSPSTSLTLQAPIQPGQNVQVAVPSQDARSPEIRA
jgi:hypothetical protein